MKASYRRKAVPEASRSPHAPIQIREGLPLTRIGLAALMTCALSLGACQTAGPPPLDGSVALASNEFGQLGRQELAAGNFGLAENYFRQAVESNAEDGPSWLGLAAAYDNLGRFELADRAYTEALRIDGESQAFLNNRGYSFYLRGDRARALAMFRRAQTLFPASVVTANNIALTQRGERPNRAAPP